MKPETLKEIKLEAPFNKKFKVGFEAFPVTSDQPQILLYQHKCTEPTRMLKDEYEAIVRAAKKIKD